MRRRALGAVPARGGRCGQGKEKAKRRRKGPALTDTERDMLRKYERLGYTVEVVVISTVEGAAVPDTLALNITRDGANGMRFQTFKPLRDLGPVAATA